MAMLVWVQKALEAGDTTPEELKAIPEVVDGAYKLISLLKIAL